MSQISLWYHILQWPKQLNDPLEVIDPEIADIIELEKARQWKVSTVVLCAFCWRYLFYFNWLNNLMLICSNNIIQLKSV